ncbi:hypothetical protein EPK99_15610 [Neorhizobium lilium]|uniref:Terminase large subunit-like endonuclease domain-containing protein n=1 Tax=Neorhizobium lilium TaxID=2503024 RepID=A0A444LGM8_9HYPH|nr:hypothetical protein EPK99_15610 [Neorhizobium lilium]
MQEAGGARDYPHTEILHIPSFLATSPITFGKEGIGLGDLTAVVGAWRHDDGRISVHPWFFVPGDDLKGRSQRDGVPYEQWRDERKITVIDGPVIEPEAVEQHIRDICADNDNVQEIAFDPHLARMTMQRLHDDGLPAIEMRQGPLTMGPAIGTLERVVNGFSIRHNGHPVLRHHFDIRAALQAAILGEGPLAGILGGKGKTSSTAGGGGKKAGGSLLGSILGLKEGGHVRGPGTGTSDSIPARLSNGEFVVNARATQRNRAVLEAINGGSVAAFAAGGYAGDAPALRKPALVAANGNAPAGSPVNINTNVTVNASGGSAEQNADLAAKVGKQVERQMRGLVADELRRQTRPGNMMNTRSR